MADAASTVWVIYHRDHDGSGSPELLRAYSSAERAKSDLEMLKRSPGMCYGLHVLVEVELDAV